MCPLHMGVPLPRVPHHINHQFFLKKVTYSTDLSMEAFSRLKDQLSSTFSDLQWVGGGLKSMGDENNHRCI